MALIKIDTISPARLNLRRADFENLQKDRVSFVIYIFSVVSILAQSSLILVSWGKLPPQVPLFYSMPWGEQILAAPLFLWILPSVAFFSLTVNYLLARIFAGEDIFLLRVLVICTFLVVLTTLYDTVKIISLLV